MVLLDIKGKNLKAIIKKKQKHKYIKTNAKARIYGISLLVYCMKENRIFETQTVNTNN